MFVRLSVFVCGTTRCSSYSLQFAGNSSHRRYVTRRQLLGSFPLYARKKCRLRSAVSQRLYSGGTLASHFMKFGIGERVEKTFSDGHCRCSSRTVSFIRCGASDKPPN
jgi:hypothetical protein